MSFFITIFNLFLYQPLFNILVLFYKYLPGNDFGIAVIILTVLIKLVFLPLSRKAIRSQKILLELQPKIKEIQEKYKEDKAKQTREILALYQKEKISPFSGCLPILVQLPVLIALYRVFWRGLQPEQLKLLYPFVGVVGSINPTFLGLIDLSQPNVFLAILAGFLQFIQTKMISPTLKQTKTKKDDFSSFLQKQTQFFFPFLTFLILLKLPSAIGLYWLTTTLFTIFQQYIILKKKKTEEKFVKI